MSDTDSSDYDDNESIATERLIEASNFDTMTECNDCNSDTLNPDAKPFLPTRLRVIQRVINPSRQSMREEIWSLFIDENPYLFYSWVKHIHPWFVVGKGSLIINGYTKGYLFYKGRSVLPKRVRKMFHNLYPEIERLKEYRCPSVMRCIILRTKPVSQMPTFDYDAYDTFYSLPSSYQMQIRYELAMTGNNWFEKHVV